MRSKSFIVAVLVFSFLLYAGLYFTYLAFPALFHFRAWELYDILVYNGLAARHQVLNESGDSAREFLVQRYFNVDSVTVNVQGNRIACFDPLRSKSPSVLILGDSQLFGSGVDDADTFPMVLCRRYGVNIYNGARWHGMNLLRVKEYGFSSILFTTAERFGFKWHCSDLEDFRKTADVPISASDLRTEPSARAGLIAANRFLSGYLKQRLGVLLRIDQPILAPPNHLIAYQHKNTADAESEELACASNLREFFAARNIKVGFIYFPSHQTVYGDKARLDLDEETLNFIPKVVTRMQTAGLSTFDTKACLMKSRDQVAVYQPHDTHLSREGFRALADCLDASELRSLFNGSSTTRNANIF